MILDATAGGRHMWFDKMPDDVLFVDKRVVPPGAIVQKSLWEVRPDVQADYTSLPFADDSFEMVVFDPPHIYRENPSGIITTTYGTFQDLDEVVAGLHECYRVASRWLVFKWSGVENPLSDIFKRTTLRPLFGHPTVRDTMWMMFDKASAPTP